MEKRYVAKGTDEALRLTRRMRRLGETMGAKTRWDKEQIENTIYSEGEDESKSEVGIEVKIAMRC